MPSDQAGPPCGPPVVGHQEGGHERVPGLPVLPRGNRGAGGCVRWSRRWLGWLLIWGGLLGGSGPTVVWADIAGPSRPVGNSPQAGGLALPIEDRIPVDRQIPIELQFIARGRLEQYRFYVVDQWLRPSSPRNPDHAAAIREGGGIEVAEERYCRVQPLELRDDRPVVVTRPLDHWPVADQTQLIALPRDQAAKYASSESVAQELIWNPDLEISVVVDRLEFKAGRKPGSALQQLRRLYEVGLEDDGWLTASQKTEEIFANQETPWWQPSLFVGLALAAAALSMGFWMLRRFRANVGPPDDWGAGESDPNSPPAEAPEVRQPPMSD